MRYTRTHVPIANLKERITNSSISMSLPGLYHVEWIALLREFLVANGLTAFSKLVAAPGVFPGLTCVDFLSGHRTRAQERLIQLLMTSSRSYRTRAHLTPLHTDFTRQAAASDCFFSDF